jgi:hypothetical protein
MSKKISIQELMQIPSVGKSIACDPGVLKWWNRKDPKKINR